MKTIKGRAGVRYVITKFSQMDSLPNFLTRGAPLCARFARARSSAIIGISRTTGILVDPLCNIKASRGMLTQMKNNPGRLKGKRVLHIQTGTISHHYIFLLNLGFLSHEEPVKCPAKQNYLPVGSLKSKGPYCMYKMIIVRLESLSDTYKCRCLVVFKSVFRFLIALC